MPKSQTRLYSIWKGIKRRCCNPNYHHYQNYGGRGITICQEWRNDFQAFYDWAMANGYEDNLTIERMDNEQGYSPSNCSWVDMVEQNNNTRHNHYVEYNGGVYTIAELSRIAGIKQNTLLYRLRRGWSIEDAVCVAVQGGK